MFKKTSTNFVGLAFAFSLLFVATNVLSADRTVCFSMALKDDRTRCPTASALGDRRPCNPGGNSTMRRFRIQLWDKDSGDGSNDDYIGTYTKEEGLTCITFPWNYSETNPDVYVKLLPRAVAAHYGVKLIAVNGNGSEHSSVWWRNGVSGNSNKYVAVDCQSGSTCYIDGGNTLIPYSNVTTDGAKRIMALDSAQRAVEVFDSATELRSTSIKYYLDDLADLPWNCTNGRAPSRTEICMPYDKSTQGDRQTHEVGHVLQKREFGIDDIRNDCGGNGWEPDSWENGESCVTQEGWAMYVAAVAWYKPWVTSATPKYAGYNIETSQPYDSTCSDNGNIPLQGAKFFWDMDDTNNEAAVAPATVADNHNNGTTGLLNVWNVFPHGTTNRRDYESGEDGVNIRDYNHHTSGHMAILEHNCVQNQTDD